MSTVFNPMILQTKQELETALKQGKLKVSKYNLLSDSEKRFVELVCFGGYTGEQAVRVINPGVKNPYAIANKVMANPDVVGTIEELTVAKDMKFKTEISAARDMALAKLQYIMVNTSDEQLAASCAKTIIDKANETLKQSTNKDEEPVGQVKFNIQVENVYNGNVSPKANEPVIIELTPEEVDSTVKEAIQEKAKLDKEISDRKEKLGRAEVGENGMKYTLHYEGVDNYNDVDGDVEDDSDSDL